MLISQKSHFNKIPVECHQAISIEHNAKVNNYFNPNLKNMMQIVVLYSTLIASFVYMLEFMALLTVFN